eukprot:TRINITY_DN65280_c0_g1_i1.p1 TRINITY_DN65280_c0_g1~~TRINITY_DN65280_c0_g1_i1.p1  ORF type:complete len:358 (+),score=81.05 TRINITY_DN65280_c0_g1_i1:112-1185(+)
MAADGSGMSDLFRQYRGEYEHSGGVVGRAIARLVEGTYRLVARGGSWPIRTGAGQGQSVGECAPGETRRVIGRDGEWLNIGSREWVRSVQPQGRWVPAELALRGEERDAVFRDAQKELECAEAALADMDRELGECDAASRPDLKRQLTVWRDAYRRLGSDLKATRSLQAECDRQALLNQDDTTSLDDPSTNDPHTRLVSTCEELAGKARNISRHTDRIVQMTEETAQTGQHSLTELRRQREVIQHAQGHVDDTNTELSRARAVISRMHKRVVKNKLMLWGIIVLLASMIGLIIYFNVKPKISSPSPPPPVVVVRPPPPVVPPTPAPTPPPPVVAPPPLAATQPPQGVLPTPVPPLPV